MAEATNWTFALDFSDGSNPEKWNYCPIRWWLRNTHIHTLRSKMMAKFHAIDDALRSFSKGFGSIITEFGTVAKSKPQLKVQITLLVYKTQIFLLSTIHSVGFIKFLSPIALIAGNSTLWYRLESSHFWVNLQFTGTKMAQISHKLPSNISVWSRFRNL